MNEAQKVDEWVRWYKAAPGSYKAQALHAVFVNDRSLFPAVVSALELSLDMLMVHMLPDPADDVKPMKFRRKHK